MKSLFKEKKIEVEGSEITIRELSAADHMALANLERPQLAAVVCKRCVVEWSQESEEAIGANVPARVMRDIVKQVFELSDLEDAKNSEPTPGDGSSSA